MLRIRPSGASITRFLGLAVFGFMVIAGCGRLGIGFARIADVIASPQRFTDKEILIQGTVRSALKIPFVSVRLYSVDDGTGEINVRTDKEPPLAGSKVHVRGMIEALAVIDDQTVGLHLREIERW